MVEQVLYTHHTGVRFSYPLPEYPLPKEMGVTPRRIINVIGDKCPSCRGLRIDEVRVMIVGNNMQYYTDGKRHLVCVPYSIDNLHRMARDLGIARCWFHKNHYDIPKRRKSVIEGLCTIVSTREIVNIIKENEHTTSNPR